MFKQNRVVITGIGVLAPNGTGKAAFWESLLEGKSGIAPITLFDASKLPCRIAGEIKNFDPLDFMEAHAKPRRMGRFSQLGIATASLAIEDAHLTPTALHTVDRLPIVMGVATSDTLIVSSRPKATSTPALIPHAVATAISRRIDIPCEITTLSNACTSGLDAISHGAGLIRNGRSDVVLAGSAEASVNPTTMGLLGSMMPSTMNDCPETASRPFDKNRRGGILSEAGAILVLESLEHAESRGAEVYAELLGSGSWIHPNQQDDGEAMLRAMQGALENSSLLQSDIGYINAHAPSDPHLDAEETQSIKALFGAQAYSIPISSIKGATGNPFGCGGSLQCVTTALALKNGILPPTTNYSIPDPACDLDYIPNEPRWQHACYALVNSRGVGGGNSSLAMKNLR